LLNGIHLEGERWASSNQVAVEDQPSVEEFKWAIPLEARLVTGARMRSQEGRREQGAA